MRLARPLIQVRFCSDEYKLLCLDANYVCVAFKLLITFMHPLTVCTSESSPTFTARLTGGQDVESTS